MQYKVLRYWKNDNIKYHCGIKTTDEAYINIDNHLLVDTENHINVKIQQRQIGYLFQDYQLFLT